MLRKLNPAAFETKNFNIFRNFYKVESEKFAKKKINLNFNPIQNDSISDFLKQKQNVCLVLTEEETQTSLNKIYKRFRNIELEEPLKIYQNENSYLVLDLERLLNANQILSLKKLYEFDELKYHLLMVKCKPTDNIDKLKE